MKPWKLQKFAGDVVYDLRNRGLLPVLVLLVVAMIAVPLLVSRGGSDSPAPSLQPTAASAQLAPENQRAVVAYSPGLRSYKKRLDGEAPKDPFRQQFAQSASEASQLGSTVSSSGTTAPVTSTPAPADGSTDGSGSGGSGSGGSGSGGSGSSGSRTTIYYVHAVADLSVGDLSQPLQRRKKAQAFTLLPDEVTPAMIYLGSSLDGKRAIFSVSRSVDQVTGEGTCAPSPTDCSVLVLGKGHFADMVNSVDGKTYRVKINKITRVVTKKLPNG